VNPRAIEGAKNPTLLRPRFFIIQRAKATLASPVTEVTGYKMQSRLEAG
jgi:hypothetical protein